MITCERSCEPVKMSPKGRYGNETNQWIWKTNEKKR